MNKQELESLEAECLRNIPLERDPMLKRELEELLKDTQKQLAELQKKK